MKLITYFSACLLTLTGVLVASSVNPINSIIALISTFFNTALMLFFFGIDFLSLIFIIVYVGAIAVLFLFVIMMVAIKTPESNLFNLNFLTEFVGKALLYAFTILILRTGLTQIFSKEDYFKWTPKIYQVDALLDTLDPIVVLGQTLYNFFGICFLVAGLILLVALIGAVLLTHNYSSKKSTENSEIQLTKNSGGLLFFSFQLNNINTNTRALIIGLALISLQNCFFCSILT